MKLQLMTKGKFGRNRVILRISPKGNEQEWQHHVQHQTSQSLFKYCPQDLLLIVFCPDPPDDFSTSLIANASPHTTGHMIEEIQRGSYRCLASIFLILYFLLYFSLLPRSLVGLSSCHTVLERVLNRVLSSCHSVFSPTIRPYVHSPILFCAPKSPRPLWDFWMTKEKTFIALHLCTWVHVFLCMF